MEGTPCVILGVKVKPGPIERYKIENFALDNTVDTLKSEAEKKTNVPSDSLELIHHGKILKDGATLQDSGIKSGEMVHVVKKKCQPPPASPQTYTDAELQQIVTALRTFGCTPNAPGWTRAMQILNDESTMSEIIEAVPSLADDCVTVSILHEVELLAALGASVHTMRRGAEARPDLPAALRHLIRLVRSRAGTNAPASSENVPTSGFAYSLEALSEDEDAEEEETEDGERSTITQEQLAAALQAATDAVSAGGGRGAPDSLLRLLQGGSAAASPSAGSSSAGGSAGGGAGGGGGRPVITAEMFSEAISAAIGRAAPNTPMEHSTAASSSASPVARSGAATPAASAPAPAADSFAHQMHHMHEMGLLDDAMNMRALLICSGDVNAAINLVFSGAIGDD